MSSTWWQTILLGVVGSYVGGFGGYLLFGFDDDEGAIQPGGIIGSFIGAVLVLLIWRWWTRRTSASWLRTPSPESGIAVAEIHDLLI